jgi:hypothetical protein
MSDEKKTQEQTEQETFLSMQEKVLSFDPVYWIEKNLTIDSKPFNLSSGAWKPFADIYRYVGIKSLEPSAAPMVLLKSRQTGGTVMASALELFFMGCGQFGDGNGKPAMRILHAFPEAGLAQSHSKTKLTAMIASSRLVDDPRSKTGKSPIMTMLLDKGSESHQFKRFANNNYLMIDSTGVTGHRLRGKTIDMFFGDEFALITKEAANNSVRMLNQSQHGPKTKGVQVFFGTPLEQGSHFQDIWNASTQQFYYLGCEHCKKHFPFYIYGSNSWEKVWVREQIVQCPLCGWEQHKHGAQSRGKWVATRRLGDEGVKFVGFHINQLYMPDSTKELMLAEKPESSPTNSEKAYRNEVLGEFFSGNDAPITLDQIRKACGVPGKTFYKSIDANCGKLVTIGIDYGALNAQVEPGQNKKKLQGESYTCAVVLVEEQQDLFSIAYALRFPKNDFDSKMKIITELIRRYNPRQVIGDIGYGDVPGEKLQQMYGDKCVTSRAAGKLKNNITYHPDKFPIEVQFDKDVIYDKVVNILKNGMVKFPMGFEEGDELNKVNDCGDKLFWLMQHCSNIDRKIVMINGLPVLKYIKAGQTDGFAALVNAWLANQMVKTKNFTEFNPVLQEDAFAQKQSPLISVGYLPRR